jgi:hypothetical protein
MAASYGGPVCEAILFLRDAALPPDVDRICGFERGVLLAEPLGFESPHI